MNFFLMKRFIDAIKNGKPIMYYNVENTKEEIQKRIYDELQNDQKIYIKQTLKYSGYKNNMCYNDYIAKKYNVN